MVGTLFRLRRGREFPDIVPVLYCRTRQFPIYEGKFFTESRPFSFVILNFGPFSSVLKFSTTECDDPCVSSSEQRSQGVVVVAQKVR